MWLKPQQRRIFLALGVTDMRKAINGLSILVEQHFEQNALSGDVFLFCNRSQTIVKALYWDRCGFCLWQKRLEKSRFKWPKRREDLLEIEFEQLAWLLDGLDISQAFETLRYERVS
jgi:transposase